MHQRTWSSARTTRRMLCAVACCVLAAAAVALAGLTAAAATPQPHSAPPQTTLQPHSSLSSPLPPPLPVFPAGPWSGPRQMFPPLSQCAHNNDQSFVQDARPGHELEWLIACDEGNSTLWSTLGRWSRRTQQFTPLLTGVQSLQSLDQAENSSLLLIVVPDENEVINVYTMDVDVGSASLTKIVSGSDRDSCVIMQAVSWGEEVIFECVSEGTMTGLLVSLWMNDLSTQRVLLNDASSSGVLQMQRIGPHVTFVAGFARIYTYSLGSGRATQPQQVFNQSKALCTGGVMQAFSTGPQSPVIAVCMQSQSFPSIATWSPQTNDFSEQSLPACSVTAAAFDSNTNALVLLCEKTDLASNLWLFTGAALTFLTPARVSGSLTFDRADFRTIAWMGSVQDDATGDWIDALQSISGDATDNFGQLCPYTCGISADEVRGVQFLSCCPEVPDQLNSLLLRIHGLQITTIVLPTEACGTITDSVVPSGSSDYDLLLLCSSQIDALQFTVVGVSLNAKPTVRVIMANVTAFYYSMFFSPLSQSIYLVNEMGTPTSVDRVDLATGEVARLITNPKSASITAFGFARERFLFSLSNGAVMSIPADARSAVNATMVMPLSADCSGVQAVQFDEGENTLWVACTERMLVLNLTSGAPSPSARVFAYPPASLGSVSSFLRDPASGLVLLSLFTTTIVLALVDTQTGAVFRVRCWNPTGVALDQRSSVLYAACDDDNLVVFSTAYSCSAGTSWDGDSCQPCAIGSAHAAAPFDPHRRHVSQCTLCAAGWVAPETGSAECTPCPAGQFVADSSNQACSPCQPGYSQNATGTTACNQCSPGRFSSSIQALNCTLAPPGSFVPLNHSSSVILCSRGSASNEWGRSTPCAQCRPGFESPQFGGTECSACPLGSSAAKGGFCSPCPVATYTPAAGSACVLCTDADQSGLICNGFASVKEGWWAYAAFDAALNESVFRTTQCPFGFCPGAQLQQTSNDTAPPQLCTPPRLSSADNWLCAECDPGFLPWGDHCDSCTAPNAPLIFAALVACFVIVAYILAGASNAGQVSVLLYFVQIAALELPPSLDWLRWLRLSNLGASSLHSCLAPLTPLEQLALTFATPLILCVVLAVIAALHSALSRCFERLASSFTRGRYLSALLGIFLFSYTAVSLAVMESLHCVSVAPGVRRLYAAPTVDCDSEEYRRFLPLAVAVLCAFLVGLPVALLVALWRRRKLDQRQHTPDEFSPLQPSTAASASVLQLGFTDSAWFWAPLILLRRFLFAIVAVLLTQDPTTHNTAFAMMHIAFLLLHQWAAPFESAELNRVERGTYVLLFVLSSFLTMLSAPYSVAAQLLLFALCVPAAAALLWWTLKHKLSRLGLGKRVPSSLVDPLAASPHSSESQVTGAPPAVASGDHSFVSQGRSHSLSLNDDSGLRRQLLDDGHEL